MPSASKSARKTLPLTTASIGRGLLPAPVTTTDSIVLAIRHFIAGTIFFNARIAEKVGLSLTDMQILHLLQLSGPSTPKLIAAATGLTSGGVTVALDRLERDGYIRREPNPDDRRSLLIHFIPSHMAKVEDLYKEVEAESRRLLSTLSESDLKATLRFFETMAQARRPGLAEENSEAPQHHRRNARAIKK